METQWEVPSINWLGGYLVARDLLSQTKAEIDDNESESFLAKMNRFNFINRVQIISTALNVFGPTLDAAQAIQAEGKGFFTDLSEEELTQKLQNSVNVLKNPNTIWKFRQMEFGSLDFSNVPGKLGCDGCSDECDGDCG